jgi:16S rRNA (guanine527-N7)-methyltransferase
MKLRKVIETLFGQFFSKLCLPLQMNLEFMNMEKLLAYFPALTAAQKTRFEKLDGLYRHWNEQINVISRKDIDNLYTHHILHSLALAKVLSLQPDAKIMDLGCGGGFPGIPLAIMYPETEFLLVDSIAKKIKVCGEVAIGLELDNVRVRADRAENIKEKFDFVVTRAVATADKLYQWSKHLLLSKSKHAMPNGIWAYKGLSNLKEELALLPKGIYTEVFPMKDFFEEEFFETKALVYMQF